MVKPQFESYRYVGEVCQIKSQSIVECRLPGSEISSILAVYAKAAPADCTCTDGEVQYGGKLFLTIVYEDGDKKVCRAERGAEFFHKAENSAVTPACFAKSSFSSENVTWRREGSGLYVSVVVDAVLYVYGSKQMEYLCGGEGLIVKKDSVDVYKNICVTGETEGEDEFETDYVGDILLHSERAIVHRTQANAGQIDIDGELALNICVLKSDNSVCSYERLVPFRMQVPCDEAFGDVTVGARVMVKSATLNADVDEEKGNSRILFTYGIFAECFLSGKETVAVVADAFSDVVETTIKKENGGGMYLTNQSKHTERINGTAILSPETDGEYQLQAAVLPRAEITVRKGERGMEAEGAVLAEILLCGADGNNRSATLTLPFIFPIDADGEQVDADVLVCGLNVKRKKNGETEAEAILKISCRTYEKRSWEYIGEVVEGEEYGEEQSGFSVFMTSAGEDLWQVSKRLGCAPEDLQKNNPELKFPLKDRARIYVYRQIK